MIFHQFLKNHLNSYQKQEVQEELKQTDGEEPTYVETSSPVGSKEYKQKARSKNNHENKKEER